MSVGSYIAHYEKASSLFRKTMLKTPKQTVNSHWSVLKMENGNFCPKTKKGCFIPLFKWEINSHIADYI